MNRRRPRERVEAALQGGLLDRPPITSWNAFPSEEWDPVRLAEATARQAMAFGWDIVKLQIRGSCFAEAFGAEYRPGDQRGVPPVAGDYPVRTVADWDRIRLRAPEVLDEQVEAMALVVEKLGLGVPILQTLYSPITVARRLAGGDTARLVGHLAEHPDAVLPALRQVADALVDFATRSIEAGAAGVFYADAGFATPDTMPVEEYERHLLPLDRDIVAALPPEGWCNVLHLCEQHVALHLGRELPVAAVSWSVHDAGNPGLADGQRLLGKAVMGGLDHRDVMLHGPGEAAEAQAAAAIRSTGGRGLLVAPGCTVRAEPAPEVLQALSPRHEVHG